MSDTLRDFAERYTAAWCSRNAASGYEEWHIGADGLVAESLGHFDAQDYQRQLDGK